MSHIQQYRQIDFVKWIMACAIVLLHLPFDNLWISIIQQYISRLGVPIFFAFSGFFCYANLEANTKRNVMKKYISRIGKLYLFWGGIYFPLLYFSGDYSLKNLLKEYLFCAPAYLWYLPAVLIGCISLIFFYKNIKSFCAFMFLSGVLYIIGTLGNSYQYIFQSSIWSEYSSVFITTRNGIFFAPLFIGIGALCYKMKKVFTDASKLIVCFSAVITYIVYCVEVTYVRSIIPYYADSSMYFSLPLLTTSIVGFTLIMNFDLHNIDSKIFREASTIIYCAQYGIAYCLQNFNSYVVFFTTIILGTLVPIVRKYYVQQYQKSI